ncbi:MAG: hypothetical protein ABFS86_09735 [Planctomycetota bacterium]
MMKHVLLTLAVLALLAAPAVRADEAKDQIKAFESAMKGADDGQKVKLIQEMAKSGNEGAPKAIAKYMMHRSDEVAVAAITAIGELKEKKYYGRLMGMQKPMKDRPAVLAAAATAIGAYGDKRGIDTLVDLGKKWLSKDHTVASAAAEGLGHIPDKRCVEELIKLLDLTYPKASDNSGTISQEARDKLAKSRPAIMKGLQTLTGWDFEEPRAWKNFWELMAKKWKPGKEEIKWSEISKWEDPGYGFRVAKPDKKWEMSRNEYSRIQMDFYVLNSDEQRMQNASVCVIAYDLSNFAATTEALKAQSKEDWYRGNWKDTKEETWVRDPKYKVGKERGFMISFTGQDRSGNILKQKNIYLVHNGFMFEIATWMRSGADQPNPELPGQIDKAIQSFRYTL